MSNTKTNNSSVLLGVILLCLGTAAMLHALGLHLRLPKWLFHWEYIPIAAGLYGGYTRRFGSPYGWLIPILIGVFFLCGRYANVPIGKLFIPVALLSAGAVVLLNALSPTNSRSSVTTTTASDADNYIQRFDEPRQITPEATELGGVGANPQQGTYAMASRFVNIKSFLGATNQAITNANISGGDVTIIMGGAEVNMVNSNLKEPATINCTLLMGGLTLVVPSDWKVINQIVPILGGVEDRRYGGNATNPDKVLILKGTAIMGGIEIHSFK